MLQCEIYFIKLSICQLLWNFFILILIETHEKERWRVCVHAVHKEGVSVCSYRSSDCAIILLSDDGGFKDLLHVLALSLQKWTNDLGMMNAVFGHVLVNKSGYYYGLLN